MAPLRWTGSRDASIAASFLAAVRTNVPPGGGLYVPRGLAPFADVGELLALPWRERSIEILARLLAPEIERGELAAIVDEALDFPLPRVAISRRRFAFELWHGPTLSFKDVGVRFLAALLERLAARDDDRRPRTVLTATSGDTGAAVAAAFHGRAPFRVAVLYPAGRISPLQERQLATLGGNVHAFAVAGSFDDCQRMVKGAFADEALGQKLRFVSANSIHVARLMAQMLYFFELAAAAGEGEPLVVAVPSGNFGNLYSGLLARELGAPIAAFVAATNANATVPEYLASGVFRARPSVETLSNAMDVGDPSNWERVLDLAGGDLDALRRALRWAAISDDETLAEVARLAALGYRADPHGAVASAALERALLPGERGLFLATAHPAKFVATREAGSALPPALASVAERPLQAEPLAASAAALSARLVRFADPNFARRQGSST